MKDLKYQIGGLDILKHELEFEGHNPYYADHKFVVEPTKEIDAVAIFVAYTSCHKNVADKFRLNQLNLVGGGSLYIDREKRLVLNDKSENYGAIPRSVAQKFAELLLPELEKENIEVSGILADPAGQINKFWRMLGKLGISFE